jgi:hypothetical protein
MKMDEKLVVIKLHQVFTKIVYNTFCIKVNWMMVYFISHPFSPLTQRGEPGASMPFGLRLQRPRY